MNNPAGLARTVAVINGKGGVFKCLAADSIVHDAVTGQPRTIAEAVTDPSFCRVATCDATTGEIKVGEVTAHLDSGLQETIRITTKTGRSVTVTGHHPLLLPDGWRRADEVKLGETIGLPAVMPEPLMPTRLSDDLVDLAAILLAEGGTSTPATRFTTTDPEIVSRAEAGASRLGASVRRVGPHGGSAIDYVLTGSPRITVEPGSCGCGCGGGVAAPKQFLHRHYPVTKLRQFRRDFGFDGTLAKHKRLPRPIWGLPNDQLARFLGVFVMCDGHVAKSGAVSITLASEGLVRDLQSLFLRLRIQSSLCTIPETPQGFRAWRITVHTRCLADVAKLPLWGYKRDRLLAKVERMRIRSNSNVGAPTLTPALRTSLTSVVKVGNPNGSGRPTLQNVARRIGWELEGPTRPRFENLMSNPVASGHRQLSPKALKAFVDEFQLHAAHAWLLSPDLLWDPVLRIEPAGPQQTFDIEVPGTHSFVANDVIVHNSSIVSSVGALLAEAGWRVLLIDLDVQGNLSEDLGLHDTTDEGRHQRDTVPDGATFTPQPTGRERLDIIHGGTELEDLTAVMQGRQVRDPDWMHALAKSIDGIHEDYDLILLDCPPGLQVLQTLALVAARWVVIPTRSDSGSRKGMRLVARRFTAARTWNSELELLGVVRTGITTSAKNIREEVRNEIAQDLGGAAPVFQTCIRYAERPAKAVRDTGRLPHELEPDAERWFKERFARMRSSKTAAGSGPTATTQEAEIVLAPSTSGLAQDYAELAQEFVDLLTAAEDHAEGVSA